MSKFCMQCGKEIEDDANVCVYCGSAQDTTGTAGDGATKKKSFIPLIAAVVVVLLVVIVIFNLLFSGGYKQPVDNMIKAIETGKGKYLYKTMPDFLIEYRYDDEKKSEIIDDLDDSLEYVVEMLEDDIKDTYDEKVKVSKGYELKIEMKIKGDDDKEKDTTKIKVYKIDGNWCLMDSLF